METQHFILSAAQVSEAFAAAGCVPLDGDFPDGLPAASGILPGALAEAGGELDPALRRILDAIARPDVSLRVARTNGGEESAVESWVLRIRDDSCVALARSGRDYQFALIGNRGAMLTLIEELIGQASDSFAGEALSKAIATGCAADSGICGQCGSLYSDAPAFCRECGDSLRRPR